MLALDVDVSGDDSHFSQEWDGARTSLSTSSQAWGVAAWP